MLNFDLAWDSRCAVAESPVWDQANHRLLFCDIQGGRINALAVDTGAHDSHDLGETVGSFGLCRSGKWIVALRHRVVLYDPRVRRIEPLTAPISEPPTNRLNDGKVGPDGAFWVGSMDENSPREPIGALYRVTADGRIERKADRCACSNGLAWSPNGRVMYHSDSTPGIVEAWDFAPATGDLSNHRQIARLSSEEGRPDGAAVDVDGNYWSAGPSAGCINKLSPAGKLLERFPFPVPGPTMPCFAGGHIYVTSLREGKAADVVARFPTLGGLFRATAPIQGVPVGVFADA